MRDARPRTRGANCLPGVSSRFMFVVITMYDDMAMAQNPAETRCIQREDDLGAHAHVPLHPAVASTPRLPPSLLQHVCIAVLGSLFVPAVKVPALCSIQNRPLPRPDSFLSFDLTPDGLLPAAVARSDAPRPPH